MKISHQVKSVNAKYPNFFPVPLTRIAHNYAQHFYQHKINSEQRKQIYLNTLAVYAVNYYLECFGVETNLEASNSWNPVIQNLANVADLVVKNCGNLECCPIWSNSDICEVSRDAFTDRIGYVVVCLNQDLTQATLLGFSKTVETGKLLINKLQPLENLVPYLDELEPSLVPVPNQGLLEKIRCILNSSWQQVEPLFDPSSSDNCGLAFGYRSAATPGQIGYLATDIINLGEDLSDREVRLNLAAIPQSESVIDVIVELCGEDLPTNLKLVAQESTGEIIISEIAQSGDTSICLQFSRQWQEPFILTVIREDFIYQKTWKYD
ncbi:DUF1822 family protein [Merismopedia glauca]|uniref:DUF1822 domain-containing protein n=1 Tax=Merismopedia glauca CCAP 1448/3 TaxID=1296344 RepID=A0A2T1C8G6_9CYAN|nr:DUF1822 family protein [Merismopedia glauca]PSB04539.1 hypothetical protein C7B64_03725 [Merismopedia glauca CCAP 1448/3]